MNFIFWQDILSPHQMPYIKALNKMGHEVTVVVATPMTEDRIRLGWEPGTADDVTLIENPDKNTIQGIVRSSHSESINVLAGARTLPLGKLATTALIKEKRRMGIISESPDPRGLSNLPRRIKYTTERYRSGRHFDFILAMGELGTRWFRKCGYPEHRILEFGYVVEPLSPLPSPVSGIPYPVSRIPSLLYAGQLIQRKGLDIFLQAAAHLQGDFLIQIIGSGENESQLKRIVKSCGLADKVQWLGHCPASAVRTHMQTADVFVLPSYHDGWGAVVNEALMAGTPVICSEQCGASTLIQSQVLGSTYTAKDSNRLTRHLQEGINAGKLDESDRALISDWARCISPKIMAKYFSDCMDHIYENAKKPMAPWVNSEIL